MRPVIRDIVILIVLMLAVWFGYSVFKPIPFLFITGIVFIALYFISQYFINPRMVNREAFLASRSRVLSAAMILFLFVLSVKVIKDYQYPRGQKPYFTNIDHHAINNYGIAFSGDLELYKDETDSLTGIWPSDAGSFRITPGTEQKVTFKFRNFPTPVFGKIGNKVYLVNPIYRESIGDRFSIGDQYTTIRWKDFSAKKTKNQFTFTFTVELSTRDPHFLRQMGDSVRVYVDRVKVKKLELRLGLDLKAVLMNSDSLMSPLTREILGGWLDRFDKNFLIPDTESGNKPGLYFFPSAGFLETGKVFMNNQPVTPLLSQDFIFNSRDSFFVGLGNERSPLGIREVNDNEKSLVNKASHVLELKGISYYSMKAATPDAKPVGQVQLRFLKNNYQQLGINEIREGFLFHNDIKFNDYTATEAVLKYYAAPAGSALDYSVVGIDTSYSVSKSGSRFSIQSPNKEATWLFSITDFSKNKFGFSYICRYLFVITLLMLALVIYRPGQKQRFLETPLLIIVYLLMVFRLLVLWRVTTFPPLDNISAEDFKTIRDFDFQFMFGIKTGPFPFSVWMVVLVIMGVFFYRAWPAMSKPGTVNNNVAVSSVTHTPGAEKPGALQRMRLIVKNFVTGIQKIFRWSLKLCQPWYIHLFVLGFVILFRFFSRWNSIERIVYIVIPVASYFYYCNQVVKMKLAIPFKPGPYQNKWINRLSLVIRHWVESPVVILSAASLLCFAICDKGFAVLFLFFLLFKNFLFSLNRITTLPARRISSIQQFFDPASHRFAGLCSLLICLVAIGYKKTFFYLLEFKLEIILAGIIITIFTLVFIANKTVRGWGLVICFIALTGWINPGTRQIAAVSLENQVRHIKYRTSILTEPVESILFNHKSNSSKEQKIIETAQSQWFINSYLDAGKKESGDNRLIRLREHFSKGASYKDQTRDVVLPRYVIAEFGGLTMGLLLILLGLPVLLFFLACRVTEDNGAFNSDGYSAAGALLLLFTLALFVWLTSTNRFVFFGQDFPFVSLTSKISTLLPMMLIGIALTRNIPEKRLFVNTFRRNMVRASVLIVSLLAVIFIAGRSNIMDKERFEIDFSKVKNRIADINGVFNEIQRRKPLIKNIPAKDARDNNEIFIERIRLLIRELYDDMYFRTIYEQASIYERSALDALLANPRVGFSITNPIHLKYDIGDGGLKLSFNKYWRFEPPAYNIKNVWKGDILEQSFSQESDKNVPVRHKIADDTEVIIVPPAFLKTGSKALGLLLISGKDRDKHDSCYILNKVTRIMSVYRGEYPAAVLGEDDIVFLTNSRSGVFRSWPMQQHNYHYFAYNFLINGHQRHIFPLGSRLFWIRHWEQACKLYYENKKDFAASTVITLDYELNKKVNGFLQARLKHLKSGIPDLAFSVIGADGNGQIRLMADYVSKRDIIDPNNDRKIQDKEMDQYFYIDNRAERQQWGNLNLLHMNLGPGSSIKPVIAAAVTSQLKAEWNDLLYQSGPVGIAADGKMAILSYAGFNLGRNGWKIESSNSRTDFASYLKYSNNLYHSLIIFLGSYQRDDFLKNGNYSLRNVLSAAGYANAALSYPVLSIGDERPLYFRDPSGWPRTDKNIPKGGMNNWFGNSESLLANGLKQNFDLYINANNRAGMVESKYSFSSALPDSIMYKRIWSFPESSQFFQSERVADDTSGNFSKGIVTTTLGGYPYLLTPLKMAEMYGKLVSQNPVFRVSIDVQKSDSIPWNLDPLWNGHDNYKMFLAQQVFGGMQQSLTAGGTATSLAGGGIKIGDYFVYAKTGTIGEGDEENSKRLAVVITKEAITAENIGRNRFYVLYFTINNAYTDRGPDKSWFWEYYRYIAADVINSESFISYMNK